MTTGRASASAAPVAGRPAPAQADVSAVPAGLVYVSDEAPGIRRVRRGESFVYRLPDGQPLRDPLHLTRIRKLAIPPAYREVWICPHPHGHLQATGRDARGRKQYRYHADWRTARDGTKFERMQEFGAALPRVRARVEKDLAAPVGQGVPRQAVLAAIVRLLDTTLVRVGNDEYARANGSFGLTTLRNRHVAVRGDALRLAFRGKSGVSHRIELRDPRVAKIVRRCQSLPGQELFHYTDDDGAIHSIGSHDVNDYLRDAAGGDFTAKDFRTWHGSVHALDLWRGVDPEIAARPTLAEAKRLLAEVAARLGNTVAVCRKAYVHPRVLALLTGEAAHAFEDTVPPRRGLSAAERVFLHFLSKDAPPTRRPRAAGKHRPAATQPAQAAA